MGLIKGPSVLNIMGRAQKPRQYGVTVFPRIGAGGGVGPIVTPKPRAVSHILYTREEVTFVSAGQGQDPDTYNYKLHICKNSVDLSEGETLLHTIDQGNSSIPFSTPIELDVYPPLGYIFFSHAGNISRRNPDGTILVGPTAGEHFSALVVCWSRKEIFVAYESSGGWAQLDFDLNVLFNTSDTYNLLSLDIDPIDEILLAWHTGDQFIGWDLNNLSATAIGYSPDLSGITDTFSPASVWHMASHRDTKRLFYSCEGTYWVDWDDMIAPNFTDFPLTDGRGVFVDEKLDRVFVMADSPDGQLIYTDLDGLNVVNVGMLPRTNDNTNGFPAKTRMKAWREVV